MSTSFFGGGFFSGEFFNVAVEVTPAGGGPRRKKRKKGLVLRWSDFESRDSYEAALNAALRPIVPEIIEEDDSDDDELILTAITRLLH